MTMYARTARHALLTTLVVLSRATAGYAQELVPNGGFEEVLECPDWQSQLDRTALWFDPSEGGSPDYYHACGAPLYALPDNTVGFQESVDGQAYAGIFLWIANVLDEWREYIEIGLTAPLIPGQCYHFRMYANLADFSGKTTDDLGVYFAMDSILSDDPYPPGMAPHLALAPGTFLDRENWTVLEGTHIASGGERFLMIGNFLWDAETSVEVLPGGPPNTGDFAYCLVDSVSLTPCGAIAFSMEEMKGPLQEGGVLFQDRLAIRMDLAPDGMFRVIDMQGRALRIGSAATAHVETSTWPMGSYVVEIRSREGRTWRSLAIKR